MSELTAPIYVWKGHIMVECRLCGGVGLFGTEDVFHREHCQLRPAQDINAKSGSAWAKSDRTSPRS